jgi:hypothetical protein
MVHFLPMDHVLLRKKARPKVCKQRGAFGPLHALGPFLAQEAGSSTYSKPLAAGATTWCQ